MAIKLMRDCRPEVGVVFFAASFGTKSLSSGIDFDFDTFYETIIGPTCQTAGMKAIRADELYGKGDITETAWNGIQRAPIVLVDFSGNSTNVAAEFALALVLGKRIVVLCQNEQDIPSDVRGHYKYIKYGIEYHSVERLKAELAKELSAILDQPSAEMMLLPMAVGGTTSVPGEVVVVTKEYAIIVTDDHRRVVLNSTDVDYRFVVGDMAKKFPVGSRVSGAFEVDFTGASKYTLTAGTANPWPGLQSQFPAGQQFVGKVDRVIGGTGAFVHVAHGVNGLIPEYKLAGRQVLAGDDVEVAVASIDVDRRRINLRLDRVLTEHRQQPRKMTEAAIEADKRQWPTAGEKLYGAVVKAVPVVNHKGGYILLETEESNPCTLMLHCSKMLPDLREDLNNGEVKVDDLIYVEIEKVDRVHNKVSVRELLEPDEGFGASAAA